MNTPEYESIDSFPIGWTLGAMIDLLMDDIYLY